MGFLIKMNNNGNDKIYFIFKKMHDYNIKVEWFAQGQEALSMVLLPLILIQCEYLLSQLTCRLLHLHGAYLSDNNITFLLSFTLFLPFLDTVQVHSTQDESKAIRFQDWILQNLIFELLILILFFRTQNIVQQLQQDLFLQQLIPQSQLQRLIKLPFNKKKYYRQKQWMGKLYDFNLIKQILIVPDLDFTVFLFYQFEFYSKSLFENSLKHCLFYKIPQKRGVNIRIFEQSNFNLFERKTSLESKAQNKIIEQQNIYNDNLRVQFLVVKNHNRIQQMDPASLIGIGGILYLLFYIKQDIEEKSQAFDSALSFLGSFSNTNHSNNYETKKQCPLTDKESSQKASSQNNERKQQSFQEKKITLAQKEAQLKQGEKLIKQKEELLENQSIASSSTCYEIRRQQEQQYICPQSGQLMIDPVVGPCQHSFERSEIQKKLRNRQECPICHEELKITQLRSNQYLARAIQRFKQKQLITQMKNERKMRR